LKTTHKKTFLISVDPIGQLVYEKKIEMWKSNVTMTAQHDDFTMIFSPGDQGYKKEAVSFFYIGFYGNLPPKWQTMLFKSYVRSHDTGPDMCCERLRPSKGNSTSLSTLTLTKSWYTNLERKNVFKLNVSHGGKLIRIVQTVHATWSGHILSCITPPWNSWRDLSTCSLIFQWG
jgi:hypothetical protein